MASLASSLRSATRIWLMPMYPRKTRGERPGSSPSGGGSLTASNTSERGSEHAAASAPGPQLAPHVELAAATSGGENSFILELHRDRSWMLVRREVRSCIAGPRQTKHLLDQSKTRSPFPGRLFSIGTGSSGQAAMPRFVAVQKSAFADVSPRPRDAAVLL